MHQKNFLGPIHSVFNRNIFMFEHTNPMHQNKILRSTGSDSTRNIVVFENTNPMHQNKVLGTIGNGSTRNTSKNKNMNLGDQITFLGHRFHYKNNPITKHLFSFESMGSRIQSMGLGIYLPPLPMKNTMDMKRNKTQ